MKLAQAEAVRSFLIKLRLEVHLGLEEFENILRDETSRLGRKNLTDWKSRQESAYHRDLRGLFLRRLDQKSVQE